MFFIVPNCSFSYLHRTTGSLSLSGTRNVLLLEQLKKNPAVLQKMRKELSALLDERLEQRGVARDTPGLANNVAASKTKILQNEREQIAKVSDGSSLILLLFSHHIFVITFITQCSIPPPN